jgi:predicted phosphodiesterase
MRLAIVSDIHGNLPALKAVWAQATRAGVEAVVNLGDILSGPLWPLETAQWLMARAGGPLPWHTIAGNHERQLLSSPIERMGASDAYSARRLGPAERAWLAALPPSGWLGDDLFFCHGRPDDDLHYLLETLSGDLGRGGSSGTRPATDAELAERLGSLEARLVLCGHSHQQRLLGQAGRLVLNPGSVGLQAFDDDHGLPHFIESGSPLARWALIERRGQDWEIGLMATPYDHEAAARQAEANGRGDWADALRSGRVGRREGDAVASTDGQNWARSD